MRWSRRLLILFAFLAGGCGSQSTPQLIENLNSPSAETRINAIRGLLERKADATQVVPALIGALGDEHTDVRRSAAVGLGSFGEKAKDAVPALQKSMRDREPSVRRAAARSLKQIDPASAAKASVR